MSRDRVVVVGAGVGGLACAIDLARRGHEVVVVERASEVGGKARRVDVGSSVLDGGPTVLTMRWVFEELWANAGGNLAQDLGLRPVNPLARHFFADGTTLDLFDELERSAEAIGAFAGAEAARGYRAFRAHARRIYEAVDRPILRGQRPTLSSLWTMGFGALAGLARADARRSYWRMLGDFFPDPRLRMLFGRYATYVGSSPLEAPASLAVISEVEQQGVWHVKGGMGALPAAMAALAARLGVSIRLAQEVSAVEVRGGRAVGVRLATGEALDARAVVLNADVAAVGAGLFGEAARRAVPPGPPPPRSLSALTWLARATASGVPIVHHDVFFTDDYEAECRALWRERRVADRPTVYVCAQDRAAPQAGSDGAERFLVLINAPARGDEGVFDATEVEACQHRTFERLEQMGLELQTHEIRARGPMQFARDFPGTGGALYGAATHGMWATFARSGARSRLPGLSFAGGSVHPGAGVPMATLSGMRAAEHVAADLASTSRSRAVAMPGGTSTS